MTVFLCFVIIFKEMTLCLISKRRLLESSREKKNCGLQMEQLQGLQMATNSDGNKYQQET
jgi:hypothetical protein